MNKGFSCTTDSLNFLFTILVVLDGKILLKNFKFFVFHFLKKKKDEKTLAVIIFFKLKKKTSHH